MLLVFSAFCHEHSYTLCLPRMMSHCASRSARLLVLLVLHVTLLARTTDSFSSKAISLETVTLRYSIYIYISHITQNWILSRTSLCHTLSLSVSLSLCLSLSRTLILTSYNANDSFSTLPLVTARLENCPQQYMSSPDTILWWLDYDERNAPISPIEKNRRIAISRVLNIADRIQVAFATTSGRFVKSHAIETGTATRSSSITYSSG